MHQSTITADKSSSTTNGKPYNSRLTSVSRDKTMINKPTSKHAKPSGIPQPRRRTNIPRSTPSTEDPAPTARPNTTSASTRPAIARPPIARQNAKPKMHVLNNAAHRPLSKEERRNTTAMSFTSGNASARTGLNPANRRAIPAIDMDQINKIQQSQALMMRKVDALQPNSATSVEDIREDFGKMMQELSSIMDQKISEATTKVEKDHLNVQVESLADALKNTEQKCGIQTDLNNDLQNRLAELNVTDRSLRAEVEQLRDEADSQRSTVRQRDSSIRNLGNELDAASLKSKETARQMEELQTNLSGQMGQIRNIEQERDTIRIDCDNIKMELRGKNTAMCNTNNQLREANELATQLQVTNETLQREFSGKMAEAQQESTAKLVQMTHERDTLLTKSESVDREVKSQEVQIVSMQEAIIQLEQKANRLNADNLTQSLTQEAIRADLMTVQDERQALKQTVAEKSTELSLLQTQMREDAKLRRKLHNMIQELKGNIRVFCRVRPSNKAQEDAPPLYEYTEQGCGVVAKVPPKDDGKVGGTYKFKFDKVFPPESSQGTVFEEISELVQSALDGYRVCIFAYGQTGSGKTHTMLGERGHTNDSGLGMIPRAVRQVFESARAMQKDGWTFKLAASFLEIYNEGVRDLLVDGGVQTGDFKLTYDAETKLCTVSDLLQISVESEQQVQKLIEKSVRNRTTAATRVNERSSRSHSVFRLYISGKNEETGQQLDGLLNLIDLAGSERLNQSKVQGDRLRETKHINKSLSALGDVISSLANREKHVPFRNSKLTYLLQDSLGGDSKTLMFVNVSHETQSMNESVCSLRFAAKVNSCHVGTATRSTRIEL